MSHSYYNVWLHIVFSTKNRENYITSNIEGIIYKYLKDQFLEVGCSVKIINGMPDHVHCLIQQNPNKSISDIIKQIKGSSFHWVNQNNITSNTFAWQIGYGVFSVSESQIDKVFLYIQNQKKHHSKQTFKDEYDSFLKLHNLIQQE